MSRGAGEPDASSVGHGSAPWAGEAWEARVGDQRIVAGIGALARVGELAGDLGGRRVVVVTDPGVRAAGHAEVAAAALAAAGLAVALFEEVGENPTGENVAGCAGAIAAHAANLVVAVGGGSALDVAKAGNLLARCGGRIEEHWPHPRIDRPLLPAIGVPTTAGTGSEAQSYALISQTEGHRKMAVGHPAMRFAVVVLDPALASTAPRSVRALAGIDAVAHAVESYVSRPANPLSRLFAAEAWRLLAGALPSALAVEPGGDTAAATQARVLLGAHLAGHAIEASMLGAAHACANPLTARLGVAHGAAVALMLPSVVRHNAVAVGERYAELLRLAGDHDARATTAGEALAQRIEALRATAGLPSGLRVVGVGPEDLEALAALAAEQWTAGFNPRPVDRAALTELYRAAW